MTLAPLDLTVAIATLADRVPPYDAGALPECAGLRYIIVCQGDTEGRGLVGPHRSDVRILETTERGAARSRNTAMAACETPLLLFADDDMTFDPAGWAALRGMATQNADVDFYLARMRADDGTWRKAYGGETPKRAVLRNTMKVGTPEIMIRVARFRAKSIAFDPSFGAGARYPVGDEFAFLADAIRAGLTGWHVPVCVGTHAARSSGMVYDALQMNARIALFRRVFGSCSFAVRIVFAIKHRARFPSRRAALSFAFGRASAPRR
ncbi:glycosyltransferase [Celeribacter sp.]|uniref:glycosyltransferase family A protein n=1 Tax=Celeribacter sp. TaxID=1890673 RepID=UPI003A8F1630